MPSCRLYGQVPMSMADGRLHLGPPCGWQGLPWSSAPSTVPCGHVPTPSMDVPGKVPRSQSSRQAGILPVGQCGGRPCLQQLRVRRWWLRLPDITSEPRPPTSQRLSSSVGRKSPTPVWGLFVFPDGHRWSSYPRPLHTQEGGRCPVLKSPPARPLCTLAQASWLYPLPSWRPGAPTPALPCPAQPSALPEPLQERAPRH